jgi:hypothetical protein
MPRSLVLVVGSSLLLAAACQPAAPEYKETPYPKLALNQDTLEFGSLEFGETASRTFTISNEGYTLLEGIYLGMQMGVGSRDPEEVVTGLDIGPGMAGFSISYDLDDRSCPEGSNNGDDTAEVAATAKSSHTGNSSGGTGGTPTDTSPTTTPDPDPDGYELFTLGPACSIPITVQFTPAADVGEVWGSLIVGTVQAEQSEEEAKAGDLPVYLRDPYRYEQQVYLHGEAERGQGTMVVKPRSYDFGYAYPGQNSPVARVSISNVGTGDMTLSGAAFTSSCDPAFSLLSSFPADYTLAAGQSTLVEVEYTPTSTDPAYCELEVTSNDATNPVLDVTIRGNTGADPNNAPPTVAIRWPEPGYEYNSPNPLELEINIFDKNQPATSLTCRVKSSLTASTMADCGAADESGHVVVSIDREKFESGADTLNVVVTDANSVSHSASVSVLVNASYPDSDDDGDAYGVESEPPDCDDSNRHTYPDAAEVWDGEDNDCDGVIDEGTEGFDDDGDGVSEADDDCNDYNAQAYPGAPERADSVDNDCDGIVDEGTSLYDDDGDGFAEVNNDCNDSDPDVNPSAVEVCDGIDNDCDGLKDAADPDGCVATDSSPQVIGYPRPSQNACLTEEQISFTVKVFDADGQIPSYQWGTDDSAASALFDNIFAQTVNFTCPTLSETSAGKLVTVYVLVTDPDGHQAWSDTKIAVYPSDYELYDPYTEVIIPEDTGGCAGGPALLFGGLGIAAALAGRRRRS